MSLDKDAEYLLYSESYRSEKRVNLRKGRYGKELFIEFYDKKCKFSVDILDVQYFYGQVSNGKEQVKIRFKSDTATGANFNCDITYDEFAFQFYKALEEFESSES